MTTIQNFLDINNIMIMIGDYPLSYIEFFGTILNVLCVRLVARNKIINWPIGIVAVVLFMILFYQIQLYSDMMEQVYFLITGFYGRWVWSKRGKRNKAHDTLPISHTTTQENIYYTIAIAIGTILFTYIATHLHTWFPSFFIESASFPLLDAFTTVLSFAATIMMAHRKITCRYLWILVDVIAIGLYYIKGVKFIALEYVLFLIIASRGLRQWYQIHKKQSNTN